MKNPAPREFWIDENHINDDYSCVSNEPVKECLHVIEYSAFETMRKERDLLVKERDNAVFLRNVEAGNADAFKKERDALEEELSPWRKWGCLQSELDKAVKERDVALAQASDLRIDYREAIKERDEARAALAESLGEK